MSQFDEVFASLARNGVRYIVVGGIAVVLQGFARFTADLDIVLDLDPPEARKGIAALVEVGYSPAVPVDPFDFADPTIRERWIRDKNMLVFPMRHPNDPMRRVDVFVHEPAPFDQMWDRSSIAKVGGVDVRIASRADLISMKREAGRPQDLLDIEMLERIQGGAQG